MSFEHEHVECSHEKVWLPLPSKIGERTLHPFSYCRKCGLVKTGVIDPPKEKGYYINKLKRAKKVLEEMGKKKLTECQIRLIIKEFEENGLEDEFGLTREEQEKRFYELVEKYTELSKERFEYYI